MELAIPIIEQIVSRYPVFGRWCLGKLSGHVGKELFPRNTNRILSVVQDRTDDFVNLQMLIARISRFRNAEHRRSVEVDHVWIVFGLDHAVQAQQPARSRVGYQ